MRPRSRRRTRLDIVALLVTVVCVAVAGWALRGLLSSPVPQAADFGTDSPVSTAQAAPSSDTPAADDASGAAATEAPESPVADRSADDGRPAPQAAAPAAGSVPTPPARSSAALADRPDPAPAPVRLRAPSVDLDVPLDAVGVAADGQMEIPEDADRAGWYRHGPAPGTDNGSAVIAGHVDDRSGPGAFLALTEAREGDELEVDLADGSTATYRIVSRVSVAKPELAVDDLFRRDGSPTLHLVTCTGEWSRQTGHYTDNLVVTAEPVQG
ncbi:class F sortase [Ornithinimicrobium pekingense]|uniref:Class F sortase n=1 Tax=Ornithinimicrobium pekingense TaxID=384677 RepID=A0ABQ2F697_9MICO|nr:class F sortase [Ornithinimicrobium pekingense]GGK56282.1 hypothetical protein GCM10011509_00830 [Ornithinimicrobium pekingense]